MQLEDDRLSSSIERIPWRHKMIPKIILGLFLFSPIFAFADLSANDISGTYFTVGHGDKFVFNSNGMLTRASLKSLGRIDCVGSWKFDEPTQTLTASCSAIADVVTLSAELKDTPYKNTAFAVTVSSRWSQISEILSFNRCETDCGR
jgi:hypothetical protein